MLPIIRKRTHFTPPSRPPKGGKRQSGLPGQVKKGGLSLRKRPPASLATGVVVRLPGGTKSIMANPKAPAGSSHLEEDRYAPASNL
jgi:hypothetical protein